LQYSSDSEILALSLEMNRILTTLRMYSVYLTLKKKNYRFLYYQYILKRNFYKYKYQRD